jgi:hypothetical protein
LGFFVVKRIVRATIPRIIVETIKTTKKMTVFKYDLTTALPPFLVLHANLTLNPSHHKAYPFGGFLAIREEDGLKLFVFTSQAG